MVCVFDGHAGWQLCKMSYFSRLSDEEFCSIDHYALETHSTAIYDAFVQRFNDLNYEIIAVIDLVHAPPMKAIFAEKKR